MKKMVILVFLLNLCCINIANAKNFQLIKNINIEGKNYQFGTVIENHESKKYVVLNSKGKNILEPKTNGFKIYNDIPFGYWVNENPPKIIFYYGGTDSPPCRFKGLFYYWNGREFTHKKTNFTDNEYKLNESEKIIKELHGNTKFDKAMEIFEQFLTAIKNNDWQKVKKMVYDDSKIPSNEKGVLLAQKYSEYLKNLKYASCDFGANLRPGVCSWGLMIYDKHNKNEFILQIYINPDKIVLSQRKKC